MNILIIGGDLRMNIAFDELKSQGYIVNSLGLKKDDNGKIEDADVVLLPVPTTRDGKNIFCPQSDKIIPLEYVKKANKNALILSCGYEFKDLNCIDYLKLDSFCYLNAVPTAEGAIAKAINDTPFCLWKTKALVIGNGRIAKILADRLKALKCDITVSARKTRDFAYLDALGIKYIHTNEVAKKVKDFNIIFNTIDVKLFDELNCLKNCYLYDLSTKGCLDFEKAKEKNIKAQKLPGIPGKIAPLTAGKIIAQTTHQLIGEWVCKI
ncbi:MAG: hypothetical protein E7521_07670 [Ruminococcaceae bacterium]|nr:hypothetical protein [Oscillospiraceae bacterium]